MLLENDLTNLDLCVVRITAKVKYQFYGISVRCELRVCYLECIRPISVNVKCAISSW